MPNLFVSVLISALPKSTEKYLVSDSFSVYLKFIISQCESMSFSFVIVPNDISPHLGSGNGLAGSEGDDNGPS